MILSDLVDVDIVSEVDDKYPLETLNIIIYMESHLKRIELIYDINTELVYNTSVFVLKVKSEFEVPLHAIMLYMYLNSSCGEKSLEEVFTKNDLIHLVLPDFKNFDDVKVLSCFHQELLIKKEMNHMFDSKEDHICEMCQIEDATHWKQDICSFNPSKGTYLCDNTRCQDLYLDS